MLKILIHSIHLTLVLSTFACTQPIRNQEPLHGAWYHDCDECEYQDLLIIRSDSTYLVYNPVAADLGSLEAGSGIKSNDLIINGSYTALTERGVWRWEGESAELIFSERVIFEQFDDSFSGFFGEVDFLRFQVEYESHNRIKLCDSVDGTKVCDSYRKDDVLPEDGSSHYYREIDEMHSGIGNRTIEILLSGYETEFEARFISLDANALLTIVSNDSIILYKGAPGLEILELPLVGVTKLKISIESEESKWSWRIGIK